MFLCSLACCEPTGRNSDRNSRSLSVDFRPIVVVRGTSLALAAVQPLPPLLFAGSRRLWPASRRKTPRGATGCAARTAIPPLSRCSSSPSPLPDHGCSAPLLGRSRPLSSYSFAMPQRQRRRTCVSSGANTPEIISSTRLRSEGSTLLSLGYHRTQTSFN